MADYKNTLNLPQTDFPMKANLAEREPQLLAQWEALDLYTLRQAARHGAEKYVLHDGPPYANGDIHLGHAVNKTLKDIVCRAQFLNGFATPYVPGWDCHGLPIEINVEKKVGKAGAKISAQQFRQACREYATTQVAKQREDFKRLGLVGDWSNPYLTMDHKFEANTIRALKAIIAKGYLKQGFKPIYWCFDCQSSLADAEVEYKEKTSPSLDVQFVALSDADFIKAFNVVNVGHGPISVVIWTTTPWTLPANYAVAVHPELSYALVQVKDQRWILARDMVTACMARYGIQDYTVLAETRGANLENLQLHHPFLDRTVPVVLGDHVTTDAGTGAVHTAPAHGEDDFRIGKKYHLPVESPVGANGVFNATVPELNGLFVFKANQVIIDLLQAKHRLAHVAQLQHSYPHCWRHKTPVVYRATPQWFVAMDKLATASAEQLPAIKWQPVWGEERMSKMLEHRPDWCISRQRTWGVPIPIFTHKNNNELHPDTIAIMERVAQQVEQHGIEAWFECNVQQLLGNHADEYVKCTDVLDVWFESGVTHYAVLAQREDLQFPADVYLEGSDQYRGWFQSSLLTSVAIHDCAPYKNLVTHGFTVDSHGHKMSKSLGNVIAPEKIMQQYGADILRLWIASTDFSGELPLSDEILKRNADQYRRIRNTARFLLSNIYDFDPLENIVAAEEMVALDRWIVMRAAEIQKNLMKDYNEFNFHLAMQKIHHFCSVELGSFYLDIIKDRQYTCKTDSNARRSAQTAMFYILEALVRWIAPVLCFTADEIWQFMPGERGKSVHLETWYQGLDIGYKAGFDDAFWQQIFHIRDAVNAELEVARDAGKIGSSLEAEIEINIAVFSEKYKLLEKLGDELRFVFIASKIRLIEIAEWTNHTPNNSLVIVERASHAKCARCWHRRADVNNNKDYPDICSRCVENIAGEGEKRLYA